MINMVKPTYVNFWDTQITIGNLMSKEKTMKTLNNYIQLKDWFRKTLVVLVLVIVFLNQTTQAEDLRLSEVRDISNVGLAGIQVQEPQDLGEVSGAAKVQSLNLDTIHTKTLTYNINIKDCVLLRKPDGFDDLTIRGLPRLTELGRPEMPIKTLTVELPKNVEVLGIEVEYGKI